jgi:hypothetical protein
MASVSGGDSTLKPSRCNTSPKLINPPLVQHRHSRVSDRVQDIALVETLLEIGVSFIPAAQLHFQIHPTEGRKLSDVTEFLSIQHGPVTAFY